MHKLEEGKIQSQSSDAPLSTGLGTALWGSNLTWSSSLSELAKALFQFYGCNRLDEYLNDCLFIHSFIEQVLCRFHFVSSIFLRCGE